MTTMAKDIAAQQAVRPVNDWVDAVYVLSVKTFAARIVHIREQMARHGIVFQFVFEHDVDALDAQLVAQTFGPSGMKKSHQSLVLKNIAVWRDAAAKNFRRILVFEDDAVLADDFATRFDNAMRAASQLPEGWLVFLGGADVKVPDRFFLAPGPLVELPMPTAEGCVSDLAAVRRRLAWLEHNKVTLPADHLTCHIDQQSGIRQYWLTEPIVQQGSTIGLFDSMLDGHRQKHSRAFNILRHRWNKFRRQRLRSWIVRLKARLGILPELHNQPKMKP